MRGVRHLPGATVISKDGVVLNGTNQIQFTIGDVPVSLVRTAMYHSDPCDEVEYDTGVILGGTRDVLTKKMGEGDNDTGHCSDGHER